MNSKKTLNKNVESEEEEEDKGKAVSEEWWGGHVGRKDEYDTLLSGKLVLLAEILKLSESIGDKVFVAVLLLAFLLFSFIYFVYYFIFFYPIIFFPFFQII